VVLGIESLDDVEQRTLLYVGASRATTSLTIVFREDIRASVTLKMPEILRLLTQPDEEQEDDLLLPK
jgi:hypothetical protein